MICVCKFCKQKIKEVVFKQKLIFLCLYFEIKLLFSVLRVVLVFGLVNFIERENKKAGLALLIKKVM